MLIAAFLLMLLLLSIGCGLVIKDTIYGKGKWGVSFELE